MIIGGKFPGDSDKFLMNIQHEEYYECLHTLVAACRREYLHAAAITDSRTDFGREVLDITNSDHRTLQMLHDVIAARFRLENPDSRQYLIDEISSADPEDSLRDRLLTNWRTFFREEAEKLSQNSDYCKPILEAVINNDIDRGDKLAIQLESEILTPYIPQKSV